MNLYLVTHADAHGYDVFDSVVVAAENEDYARLVHPSEYVKDWNGISRCDSWPDADQLDVDLIGAASEGTARGVILASFNAG